MSLQIETHCTDESESLEGDASSGSTIVLGPFLPALLVLLLTGVQSLGSSDNNVDSQKSYFAGLTAEALLKLTPKAVLSIDDER